MTARSTHPLQGRGPTATLGQYSTPSRHQPLAAEDRT